MLTAPLSLCIVSPLTASVWLCYSVTALDRIGVGLYNRVSDRVECGTGFVVIRCEISEINNFTYCHSVDNGGEGCRNWQGCR